MKNLNESIPLNKYPGDHIGCLADVNSENSRSRNHETRNA